jgi:hypothetical protein
MDSDLYTDDQTYDISDVYFCNECFFARLLNCRLTHLILHLGWATQAQPTEPLVTIQTAYHLFWFLLQNVYHIFLVFFSKTVFSTLSAFIIHFELFDYFYYTFPNDFFPLLKKMVPMTKLMISQMSTSVMNAFLPDY